MNAQRKQRAIRLLDTLVPFEIIFGFIALDSWVYEDYGVPLFVISGEHDFFLLSV